MNTKLTFDEATLDNSMNDAIEDIISRPKEMRSTEEQAEIYLYYVACTRCKYKLNNARHLIIEETEAKSPRDYFNNLEEVEI